MAALGHRTELQAMRFDAPTEPEGLADGSDHHLSNLRTLLPGTKQEHTPRFFRVKPLT
jgi:hypothetical protein